MSITVTGTEFIPVNRIVTPSDWFTVRPGALINLDEATVFPVEATNSDIHWYKRTANAHGNFEGRFSPVSGSFTVPDAEVELMAVIRNGRWWLNYEDPDWPQHDHGRTFHYVTYRTINALPPLAFIPVDELNLPEAPASIPGTVLDGTIRVTSVGELINLAAITALPVNATNATIRWEREFRTSQWVSAGSVTVPISGNSFNVQSVEGTPMTGFMLRATIENGRGRGLDFEWETWILID